MLRLSSIEEPDYTWLFIESRAIGPEFADLSVELPQVAGGKGLILCGSRQPPWAIAHIAGHYRNLTRWLGVYVPKQALSPDHGVLVVHTTDFDYPRGKVLPLRLPCLACHRKGKTDVLLRADASFPYCARHQNHNPARQTYIPRGRRTDSTS